MNGEIYLLDTNAIIYGINAKRFVSPGNYIISIITEMELLSYSESTALEAKSIKSLLSNFLYGER